ncbi:MAG: glycoside hydrolase family 5 protein [Eubacterium sp.]|nr:glycoside hydrolase family 5 protein [Eubacterium sp.]
MEISQKRKWSIMALAIASFMLAGCGHLETPEEQSHASSDAETLAASKTAENASDISAFGGSAASQAAPVSDSSVSAASSERQASAAVSSGTPSAGQASADAFPGTPSAGQPSGPTDSFAALHGALSVNGADLTDQNGDPIQLYGMSTHGIAWFPQYVNYDSFRTLRDDWNTNCVRLALYSDEYNGYSSGGDQEELKNLVKNGIDYATDLGMYVIVDWHILNDRDPNVHKEDAIAFFREISSLYGDHTNILYEICNEPNGYATWDSVKSYANEVIPVIRENDGDAVILVGSPTWSQDIDQAAASPLSFDNVMYTLHFYAATHTDDLRSRLETCVNGGLPVFVSEFGMCDASGNGGNNFNQAEKWMELLDKYNISFFCWSLANKAETCCVLDPGCEKTSDWTESDLSESGRWIREQFIAH